MIYQGIVNVSAINDFDNVKYLTDCVSVERKNRISKFLRDEDKVTCRRASSQAYAEYDIWHQRSRNNVRC